MVEVSSFCLGALLWLRSESSLPHSTSPLSSYQRDDRIVTYLHPNITLCISRRERVSTFAKLAAGLQPVAAIVLAYNAVASSVTESPQSLRFATYTTRLALYAYTSSSPSTLNPFMLFTRCVATCFNEPPLSNVLQPSRPSISLPSSSESLARGSR